MMPPLQQMIDTVDALEEAAGLASLTMSGAKPQDLLEWYAAQMLRQIIEHVQQQNQLELKRQQYLNSLADYEDSMRSDYDYGDYDR